MQTITVDELKRRLEQGENIRLLDVREDFERVEFNIGGEHIPMGEIQDLHIAAIDSWKGDEIIIYCRSGNRSGKAALILEQAGFKHPVNLLGGMLEWREKLDKVQE